MIFGEMAVFKIVPFIATHVKMKFCFSWSNEKKISPNQNSPFCMKTTDIKLLRNIGTLFKLLATFPHDHGQDIDRL